MGQFLEVYSGAEILNVCTGNGGGLWHTVGGQVVVENTCAVIVVVWVNLTVVNLGDPPVVQGILLKRS